jgi:hypothetical protein
MSIESQVKTLVAITEKAANVTQDAAKDIDLLKCSQAAIAVMNEAGKLDKNLPARELMYEMSKLIAKALLESWRVGYASAACDVMLGNLSLKVESSVSFQSNAVA